MAMPTATRRLLMLLGFVWLFSKSHGINSNPESSREKRTGQKLESSPLDTFIRDVLSAQDVLGNIRHIDSKQKDARNINDNNVELDSVSKDNIYDSTGNDGNSLYNQALQSHNTDDLYDNSLPNTKTSVKRLEESYLNEPQSNSNNDRKLDLVQNTGTNNLIQQMNMVNYLKENFPESSKTIDLLDTADLTLNNLLDITGNKDYSKNTQSQMNSIDDPARINVDGRIWKNDEMSRLEERLRLEKDESLDPQPRDEFKMSSNDNGDSHIGKKRSPEQGESEEHLDDDDPSVMRGSQTRGLRYNRNTEANNANTGSAGESTNNPEMERELKEAHERLQLEDADGLLKDMHSPIGSTDTQMALENVNQDKVIKSKNGNEKEDIHKQIEEEKVIFGRYKYGQNDLSPISLLSHRMDDNNPYLDQNFESDKDQMDLSNTEMDDSQNGHQNFRKRRELADSVHDKDRITLNNNLDEHQTNFENEKLRLIKPINSFRSELQTHAFAGGSNGVNFIDNLITDDTQEFYPSHSFDHPWYDSSRYQRSSVKKPGANEDDIFVDQQTGDKSISSPFQNFETNSEQKRAVTEEEEVIPPPEDVSSHRRRRTVVKRPGAIWQDDEEEAEDNDEEGEEGSIVEDTDVEHNNVGLIGEATTSSREHNYFNALRDNGNSVEKQLNSLEEVGVVRHALPSNQHWKERDIKGSNLVVNDPSIRSVVPDNHQALQIANEEGENNQFSTDWKNELKNLEESYQQDKSSFLHNPVSSEHLLPNNKNNDFTDDSGVNKFQTGGEDDKRNISPSKGKINGEESVENDSFEQKNGIDTLPSCDKQFETNRLNKYNEPGSDVEVEQMHPVLEAVPQDDQSASLGTESKYENEAARGEGQNYHRFFGRKLNGAPGQFFLEKTSAELEDAKEELQQVLNNKTETQNTNADNVKMKTLSAGSPLSVKQNTPRAHEDADGAKESKKDISNTHQLSGRNESSLIFSGIKKNIKRSLSPKKSLSNFNIVQEKFGDLTSQGYALDSLHDLDLEGARAISESNMMKNYDGSKSKVEKSSLYAEGNIQRAKEDDYFNMRSAIHEEEAALTGSFADEMNLMEIENIHPAVHLSTQEKHFGNMRPQDLLGISLSTKELDRLISEGNLPSLKRVKRDNLNFLENDEGENVSKTKTENKDNNDGIATSKGYLTNKESEKIRSCNHNQVISDKTEIRESLQNENDDLESTNEKAGDISKIEAALETEADSHYLEGPSAHEVSDDELIRVKKFIQKRNLNDPESENTYDSRVDSMSVDTPYQYEADSEHKQDPFENDFVKKARGDDNFMSSLTNKLSGRDHNKFADVHEVDSEFEPEDKSLSARFHHRGNMKALQNVGNHNAHDAYDDSVDSGSDISKKLKQLLNDNAGAMRSQNNGAIRSQMSSFGDDAQRFHSNGRMSKSGLDELTDSYKERLPERLPEINHKTNANMKTDYWNSRQAGKLHHAKFNTGQRKDKFSPFLSEERNQFEEHDATPKLSKMSQRVDYHNRGNALEDFSFRGDESNEIKNLKQEPSQRGEEVGLKHGTKDVDRARWNSPHMKLANKSPLRNDYSREYLSPIGVSGFGKHLQNPKQMYQHGNLPSSVNDEVNDLKATAGGARKAYHNEPLHLNENHYFPALPDSEVKELSSYNTHPNSYIAKENSISSYDPSQYQALFNAKPFVPDAMSPMNSVDLYPSMKRQSHTANRKVKHCKNASSTDHENKPKVCPDVLKVHHIEDTAPMFTRTNFTSSNSLKKTCHGKESQSYDGEVEDGQLGASIVDAILNHVSRTEHLNQHIGPGLHRKNNKPTKLEEENTDMKRNRQKIIDQITTIIDQNMDSNTKQKQCVKLSTDLQDFLKWLQNNGNDSVPHKGSLSSKLGSSPSYLNNLYSINQLNSSCSTGGHRPSQHSCSDSPSYSSENKDLKRKAEILEKLIGEYEELSASDKSKVKSVHKYLSEQLNVVNQMMSSSDEHQRPCDSAAAAGSCKDLSDNGKWNCREDHDIQKLIQKDMDLLGLGDRPCKNSFTQESGGGPSASVPKVIHTLNRGTELKCLNDLKNMYGIRNGDGTRRFDRELSKGPMLDIGWPPEYRYASFDTRRSQQSRGRYQRDYRGSETEEDSSPQRGEDIEKTKLNDESNFKSEYSNSPPGEQAQVSKEYQRLVARAEQVRKKRSREAKFLQQM